MQCLNCSAVHREEVLLCKNCRLPLWNLVAAVQKCGECGKRWSMYGDGCGTCAEPIPTFEYLTVNEKIHVTVVEEPIEKSIEELVELPVEEFIEKPIQVAIVQPKKNKEISASTIFVKAEAEKRKAKNTNFRVKVLLWVIMILTVIAAVTSALIWLYDPYYFYETYYSLKSRWF